MLSWRQAPGDNVAGTCGNQMKFGAPAAAAFVDGLGAVFFWRTCGVGMHFDDGRVQAHCLNVNAHELLRLQVLKHGVEHAGPGPAAHARVDGVPVAIVTGKRSPLAAVGCHVQDGVGHVKAAWQHVAALAWQQRGDFFKLLTGQLHWGSFAPNVSLCQIALTRPRRGTKIREPFRYETLTGVQIENSNTESRS